VDCLCSYSKDRPNINHPTLQLRLHIIIIIIIIIIHAPHNHHRY
jgi:hypothetical protein